MNSKNVRRVVVAKHPPKTRGIQGVKRASLPVTIRDSATLRNYLQTAHKRLKSWNLVHRLFPSVKRGTLQRFATTKYEPKRPDVRMALGLPVLSTVPVCPYCGNVYMTKRRIEYTRRVSKPRRITHHGGRQ